MGLGGSRPENYNKNFIELLNKCDIGDKDAINEYNGLSWKHIGNNVTFCEEFLKSIITLSDNNNPYAQNILGLMYKSGSCELQKNYQKSIELFEKSAEKGDSCALCNLGRMYLHGVGVDRNYIKAEELFLKAIQCGNNHAIVNMAYIYQEEEFGKYDIEKAKQLYEEAVEKGVIEAMHYLAYFYITGKFGEKNPTKTVELFKKSNYDECFHDIINEVIEQSDKIDIAVFKDLIKNIPKSIYEKSKYFNIIQTMKQMIKHEENNIIKEVTKTILITKGIPVEIIDSEINAKI